MYDKDNHSRVRLEERLPLEDPANAQGTILNIIYSFSFSLGMYCVPSVVNGVSVVATAKKGSKLNENLQKVKVLGDNILTILKRIKRVG